MSISLIRRRLIGEEAPWYFGNVRTDWLCDEIIIAVVPINFILRFWDRWVYVPYIRFVSKPSWIDRQVCARVAPHKIQMFEAEDRAADAEAKLSLLKETLKRDYPGTWDDIQTRLASTGRPEQVETKEK